MRPRSSGTERACDDIRGGAAGSEPARRLLIFDLDGTLLDTVDDLATAVNLMRARYGLGPLDSGTVAGYVGDGVRRLVERALDGVAPDLDAAMAFYRAFYLEHLCDRTKPYPGVSEGLRRLKEAGCVLAVATNKPHDACVRLLEHFGLMPLFHSVCGGGSVGQLKPHPEMLETIMRSAGIGPADTWMVGDHRTDMEAARRAGVRSVFLTYGIGHPGDERPTVTVPSFGELEKVLLAY